jgi:hypothetical protein
VAALTGSHGDIGVAVELQLKGAAAKMLIVNIRHNFLLRY